MEGGGGWREEFSKDEVLHESVPGPRPTLWRHRDEDPVLPSTVFSFPSLFYGWWRTSSYTQSWMGKHEISSNVLQLNTVKKKKKKRKKERKKRGDDTSAWALWRKWEWAEWRRGTFRGCNCTIKRCSGFELWPLLAHMAPHQHHCSLSIYLQGN